MKKLRFSVVFATVFLLATIGIRAQSQPSPFAGNWMLDKEKSDLNNDFLEKLKTYKMAVNGDTTTLNVKSQVEGDVEVKTAGNGSRATAPIDNGSLTRRDTVAGPPTGSSVNQGPERINYGGTLALFFTVKDATYNLNGEEVKVDTNQGLVRVRAKPDKSGKGLQLTTIRRMKMPKGEMEVTVRETWKLSDDGKSLKLQRTVETPSARDQIIMFLAKVG